jgi:TusA-related sulfurtransferase
MLEDIPDDPTAAEDITRFAKRAGHEVIAFENTDGRSYELRRGSPCHLSLRQAAGYSGEGE